MIKELSGTYGAPICGSNQLTSLERVPAIDAWSSTYELL